MKYALYLLLATSLTVGHSLAQTPALTVAKGKDALAALAPEERAIHDELIAFRIAIQAAFNKVGESGKAEDMAPLLELVHPDVILTAMNGQSVRGKNGIMEYFKHHMIDEGHYVKRLHHDFEADELSNLLKPDVAINRGTSLGTYVFTDGKEFKVHTRWTATMVKLDGRWTVVAFQFGPSIFDNPVLDAAIGWIKKGAAIAGVVGLLLGVIIGRKTAKR
ncbi:MAG: nuclear transport factor 2 family protein [Verrucomicrobiota bacterium]